MSIKDFIFESREGGQGLGQKIFRNAFWITTSDVVNRLLKAALIVYATRTLPIAEYGAFGFALNLVALVFIVGDLGVSNVLYRKLALKEDKEYISTSFVLELGLLAAASVIALVVSVVSGPGVSSVGAIFVLMMFFGVLKNFFLVFHSSQNRMDKVALANTLEAVVAVVVGLVVLSRAPSAIALAWVYVLGAFVSLTVVLWTVKRHLRNLLSFVRVHLIKKIGSAALPLALGGVVWGFMSTTDSLILGWIQGMEVVAFYNAAYKVLQFLGPIGGIVVGATLPSLVSTRNDPERHKRLFRRSIELLFLITIPIAIGGLIIASPFIQKLYGARYEPAVIAFSILILSPIHTSVSYFLGQLIFVHNRQLRSFLYVSIAWISNVVLSLILIPLYGLVGAALASFISYGVIFVTHVIFVKKAFGLSVFSKELLKPAVAALGMGISLLLIGAWEQSVFLSIPVGVVVYGVILIMLKPQVLRELKSIFRSSDIKLPFTMKNL